MLRIVLVVLMLILRFDNSIAAPSIQSISPTNGSINGGNVITIEGSGFTGASAVILGNRPASSFTIISDTEIQAVVPLGTAGTVDVRVTVGSQTSPLTRNDFYTYTQDSWNGIISAINQDAITLFDTANNTINGTIPLPSDSLASVITPDGTKIYAAYSDQGLVSVIDAATNTIIMNIPTPIAGPGAFDIIVSPDGTRVYVSNFTSGFVTVIDTINNTVITDILLSPGLGSLSVTPDGSTVFVDNFSSGNVTPIDTASFTPGTSITTGFTPGAIAITPDGTIAYATSAFAVNNNITIIDVATQTSIGTIPFPLGAGPYGAFILPTGTTMYVANIENDTVSVVDLTTNTIVNTINLVPGSRPFWVVGTPDSKTIYVLNESTDHVTPIDVATNTAGPSFANSPGDVQDLVMSPDPAPVASFIGSIQPPGIPSVFDASASLSPIGTIVSYEWDFGDGTPLVVTASPIVNHIYATTGSFNVTLRVTNSAGTSTAKVFSSRFMSNNGGPTAITSQFFPAPPSSAKGSQICCRYPTQTDIINLITWNLPLVGTAPLEYQIYRDALLTDLIATIPASSPLQFSDHNRLPKTTYTYYLVSVSSDGLLSSPITIIVEPLC
ncbi:MAG TPA: PKD domain-containing protein [Candidatus Babeliales bacterium]|nr:PKD domain-containing protein [Candidatus Babeliales bacterium]